MDNFEERIERMGQAIAPYAKAKSERTYIDKYRKSLKAVLMSKCKGKTVSERENYAYAHKDYLSLLVGLKEATELETKTQWALEKFKIEFSHWQTCSANERWQRDKV